jgi:hypothetical protein
MNSDIREQIYNNMNLKETDELLNIWETNDRVEWSDEAFAVVEEILKARIGNMPTQNEPVLEYNDEEMADDDLEDWEIKLLDDDNQPEFYNTLEVLFLKGNINIVIKAAIVVNVLLGVLNYPNIKSTLLSRLSTVLGTAIAGAVPVFVLSIFVTMAAYGIRIAVVYFPLKALGHILRILMQMEFNSRKA